MTTVYDIFAKKINDSLKRGKVEVVDTKGLDKFCDDVSLRLDYNVMALLYDERDTETAQLFFDTVVEHNGSKYYIEPYSNRLMNISRI